MQLRLETKESGGKQVLVAQGEINFSTISEFKAEFSKLLDLPAPKLVVDMSGVTYIDSSGIASFVEAMQKIKARGGSLGLVALNDNVKSVFVSTKLDKMFNIFSDLDEALAA